MRNRTQIELVLMLGNGLWLYFDPGWEPVIAIVALLGELYLVSTPGGTEPSAAEYPTPRRNSAGEVPAPGKSVNAVPSPEPASSELDLFLRRLESMMPKPVSSPAQAVGAWISAVGGMLLGVMIANAFVGPSDSGWLAFLLGLVWLSIVGGFLAYSGITLHKFQNDIGRKTAKELMKIEHVVLTEMQRRGHFD